MDLTAHFVRLFDYDARCTPRVVESLRRARAHVEETGLAALVPPYERAVAVFCHVQAARRLWLHRLDAARTPAPADGIFPIWPLDRAAADAAEVDQLWTSYVPSLDEPALSRVLAYTSTEGVPCRSVIADVLTHVVNHSSYHRGQIASLLAATGTRPAVTDYVALTRE